MNQLHCVYLTKTVGTLGVSIGIESSEDAVDVPDIESSYNPEGMPDSPSSVSCL